MGREASRRQGRGTEPADRLRPAAARSPRQWRLQRRMHRLRQLIEGKESLVTSNADTSAAAATALDPQTERRLAAQLFNNTWALLEHTERTPEDDDRMVHMAHASRYHWGQVGEPRNLAIGEWQCSRVYAVLGRAESALHHARRELELADRHRLGPFILATAYEALARASAVAGDRRAFEEHRRRAREAAAAIEDAEEREVAESDIASLPPVAARPR